MIRGNYSLANELKARERKQQAKIQKRQKHQNRIEKLTSIDAWILIKRINRLESKQDRDEKDNKYLKDLKNDIEFMKKNGIQAEKIDEILKNEEEKRREREKADKKLWGSKSIYFNPELNPLGKVPSSGLSFQLLKPLPNSTKPLKRSMHIKVDCDPIIEKIKPPLPEGPPPKFYKKIFNTEREKVGDSSGALGTNDNSNSRDVPAQESEQSFHDSYGRDHQSASDDDPYNESSNLAPEEVIALHERDLKKARLH